MDQSLGETLLGVERLLKDKCTHYLVLVMDGEHYQALADSRIVGHGLATRFLEDNKVCWKKEEMGDGENGEVEGDDG